jgi:hypothetical protein
MQLNDIALLQIIFMNNLKEIISVLSCLSRGLLTSDDTGEKILTSMRLSRFWVKNLSIAA